MINSTRDGEDTYIVKKTLKKRAIGPPNIKRKNHTTHIVCLSTETFPLTVVGKQVNYIVPRGFL